MLDLGILKYWQGIVEVILRIVTIILLFIVFICTAAVVGSLSQNATPFAPIESLRFNSRSPSGWILLVTILAAPYAIVSLMLRFLDVGCIIRNVKMFLIVDFIIDICLAVALFCGAIPMAFYQSSWVGYTNSGSTEDKNMYNFSSIIAAMGASAAFSFITTFVVVALAVWLILSLVLNWNMSKPTYRKNDFTPKVTMVTSDEGDGKVAL